MDYMTPALEETNSRGQEEIWVGTRGKTDLIDAYFDNARHGEQNPDNPDQFSGHQKREKRRKVFRRSRGTE